MAAVGHQAVRRAAVFAVERRHGVAHLCVDRDFAAVETVADVFVEQTHAVFIIFYGAVVEHDDVAERIDVNLQLALVVLRQQIVTLEMVFAARDALADDLDELFARDDEHAHADEVILRRAVIDGHILDLAVCAELERGVLDLFAVGDARLGDDRDVAAGADMLFHNEAEVDRAEHRRIREDDIVRVAALEHRHGRLQGLELAVVGPGVARGIGRQEAHAVAELEVPFLAVAEVIHQRLIVILCDDADALDAGVCHVGEHEVHLAVAAPERDGGRGAHRGQLAHVIVVDIGKNDAHCAHFKFLLFRGL